MNRARGKRLQSDFITEIILTEATLRKYRAGDSIGDRLFENAK